VTGSNQKTKHQTKNTQALLIQFGDLESDMSAPATVCGEHVIVQKRNSLKSIHNISMHRSSECGETHHIMPPLQKLDVVPPQLAPLPLLGVSLGMYDFVHVKAP